MGRKGFTTRQVQGSGQTGATPRATPIYLTAGFTFDEFGAAGAHFDTGEGYAYTRIGNPTIEAVESTIAGLEGGAGALLVASGQAATSVALMTLASAGDHVVVSNHIYEGTRGLLLDSLSRFGIDVSFVHDIHDPSAWEAAIRPETRVLFAESISNATNRLLDVAEISAVAHAHGLPLVIDNTFATPYLFRPIEHGADVVVHSASKFLAGHGAVIGGAIVDAATFDVTSPLFPQLTERDRSGTPSPAERAGAGARLAYARDSVGPRLGPTPSPLNAFLIGQGIETLSLRVERQSANALTVARWLAAHDAVESVDYVGLEGHADHALAERLLPDGFGSVFTVTLRGGAAAAESVIEAVRTFTHMTHLGDVRSLVLHPASTSHIHLSDAERAALGVFPGTLRLSVGIEDADDLIDDLTQALAVIAARDDLLV
ncbi:O-acetylhomoserine aminocarboxypropyltransferase/cysteine synthase family protein [uncultured Microbacterium sp.]|uniref:O-acetylhomoserine aminocarboxypropyltransferase/cysteine synthase family protein n=1 Tax=uncultured Microbacterium sp. TaxID=191216 RepID=UPI00261FD7B3|nr:aminotransferase class I/II-fold pyridoxal phosphate-dependent enzyme [uncultured Microbacterium sp.]